MQENPFNGKNRDRRSVTKLKKAYDGHLRYLARKRMENEKDKEEGNELDAEKSLENSQTQDHGRNTEDECLDVSSKENLRDGPVNEEIKENELSHDENESVQNENKSREDRVDGITNDANVDSPVNAVATPKKKKKKNKNVIRG